MKTYLNNKKQTLCFAWFIGIFLLWSCGKEASVGSEPVDDTPPGVPEVIEIVNVNGAATIHYKVPSDNDLLYVCASYSVGENQHITKASPYQNSLEVVGFPKKGDYPVSLYSVDRSFNESEKLEVIVSPDVSPVEAIFESMEVVAAFGGIRITWENITNANVIIAVTVGDSLGEFTNVENFYSSTLEGLFTVRGFDTIPRQFGVAVRDRWDNFSEEAVATFAPMFEVEIDKADFREVNMLPGDAPVTTMWGGDFPVEHIWDGDRNSLFHGEAGDLGKCVTFNLGHLVKLSRFKMYQRDASATFVYGHNNTKHYKVYGATEITAEMMRTGSLEPGDGWTLIKDAWDHKPSGRDNPNVTSEDREYALGGDEQEISLDAPAVQYLRIQLIENWSASQNPQLGEMSFWGQIID